MSDKIYKNTIASSTGQLTISLGAILENLESGATTPKPMLIHSALGNDLFIKPILTGEKFVRYYPDNHKIFKQSCSLDNFTVFDVETANMYPDSVCQIGFVQVENAEIVESKSFFIRPPYNDFRNSYLHGISLEDVKNSKTFAELWPDIKPFFKNQLIAAYNSNFDVGCLLATLENFKIPPPNFAYFDILQNARDILADKILRHIKKLLRDKTPQEIGDFHSILSLLDVSQNKVADVAKVLKLKGSVFEFFGFKLLALDNYKLAFSLNDKIGVKSKIQALESELT